jgi:hypothetical protein
MIEHMFDKTTVATAPSPYQLAAFDPGATLAAAETNERELTAAEHRRLALAAHWADLHGHLDQAGSSALPGAERLLPLGGDGTPEVAEFCPAELAAVLGISAYAGAQLIADALDLRHRLPILWHRIGRGEVKPSIGRRVAQATRQLSVEASAIVDAKVSRWSARLTWARLAPVVDAAIIEADPSLAAANAEEARSEQGVWITPHDGHGIGTAFIRAAAPDLLRLDAALNRIASSFAALGDDTPRDQRRARAVGTLANPQETLQLYREADTATGDAPTPAPATRPVDTRPDATLYVHLTDQAMHGDGTVTRVEGVGPILIDTVKAWLEHCRVTVKPVIDLPNMTPVDGYELPDRTREAVHLLSPADCFPYASRTNRRSGDIDHTIPYLPPGDGGLPGQTGIGNLGPVTRFHHRIKTHSGWQVRQPFPGIYLWRSPHGRYFLIDPTGTRPIPTPS